MTATTATLPARRLMTHLAANVSHALRPTQKTTRPMGVRAPINRITIQARLNERYQISKSNIKYSSGSRILECEGERVKWPLLRTFFLIYAKIIHFGAKFLLSYKMHPVNREGAVHPDSPFPRIRHFQIQSSRPDEEFLGLTTRGEGGRGNASSGPTVKRQLALTTAAAAAARSAAAD